MADDSLSDHVSGSEDKLQQMFHKLEELRMADTNMCASPESNEEASHSQQATEGATVPVRNIQHLIRRRERRSHRSHAEPETLSMPLAQASSPVRPRLIIDYGARNRELQSRPRRNHYITRCNNRRLPHHVVARQGTYTSVFAEMKSQIIEDIIESPSEINRWLRRYLRWYQSHFPRDDPGWHQYKAEWAVWMRFYDGHAKRDAFIGVEPRIPRAYTRAQRALIYEDAKLGSLMKRIGI